MKKTISLIENENGETTIVLQNETQVLHSVKRYSSRGVKACIKQYSKGIFPSKGIRKIKPEHNKTVQEKIPPYKLEYIKKRCLSPLQIVSIETVVVNNKVRNIVILQDSKNDYYRIYQDLIEKYISTLKH